ncbi:MAG: ATP-binding cassette domain-containing protein [Chitinophagales bacterium]
MAFLEIRNISKSFGGVHALKEVSFSVDRGEIHAICGENGAGKSTLIKILSGVYPTHSHFGEIILEGRKQDFVKIKDAESAGIAVIHQELSLVKHMMAGENIFLGREPRKMGIINYNRIYSESKKLLDLLGLDIDPAVEVIKLGIGEQQLIEIAKALGKNAGILILDEPTTALSEYEIDKLLHILLTLKEKGVTLIYISHKLNEIMRLCDRVSVMRDGRYIATRNVKDITEQDLVSLMVGRELTDFYPRAETGQADAILSVQHLTLFDAEISEKKKVNDVSFEVRRGEILGIAGLMGSGRTELLSGLFGAWKGKLEGKIFYKGRQVFFHSPKQAIQNGLALVSEDRKRYGLILEQSVGRNLNLASLKAIALHGILDFSKELKRNLETISSVGIKVKTPDAAANTLSGGNQQKVVLGKWLLTNPEILFLDEPTRGIDVGAKYEIYHLMNMLVEKGMAVVMVSSDLPEVLGMSHRILVLHNGKLAGEFSGRNTSQQEVMLAATGQHYN